MMRKIKLTVAYKGTHYAGWQIQPNGDSIQGRLVSAICNISREKVTLYASGRTDAGVHAAGQVAHFVTDSAIGDDQWPAALNTMLPENIRVLSALTVPESFHAQYSAHEKTYCYRLYTDPVISPFYDDFAWHVRVPLSLQGKPDLAAMAEAAKAFWGRHDFKGFMSTGSAVKDTVREIKAVSVNVNDHTMDGTELIEISVTGNGFLYNMVRIMAGTLVAVGTHQMKAEDVPGIIASGDRNRAGITAPAKGLMLMQVRY